jgi:prevent-host-death family protein
MTEVGAYEAKTHLPRLLEEVARGRTITITKHGRPVARLVPVAGADGAGEEIAQEIRRARSRVVLGDLSVTDLIDEGRR